MPLPSREALLAAIKKALESSDKRNFKQSVELIIALKDIDVKSQAAKIREVVFLPKGRGKDLNMCSGRRGLLRGGKGGWCLLNYF